MHTNKSKLWVNYSDDRQYGDGVVGGTISNLGLIVDAAIGDGDGGEGLIYS